MFTLDLDTDPLARSTATSSQKTALIDLTNNERLTYAALDRLVDRVAAWLTSQLDDKAAGQRIAYLGRNGVELVAIALGAERAGLIFVPLYWRLAQPELAALIADCSPTMLIAQQEFLPLLPGRDCRTGILHDLPDDGVPLPRPANSDRPVVLLYTSGTTGAPKGVIVTANNALAASLNFLAVSDIGEASVTFSDLPQFHTIGLIAVTRSTLMASGTVILADRFSPARTLAVLSDPALAVTHYFAVPVMAEALLCQPGFDGRKLSGLRAIFLGGAPLSTSLIERYLSFGVPLVNGYGMSEAGTAIHVPPDIDSVRKSAGAVGIPAPHIQVRVVRDGRDVAAGEVGELRFRGPSISPGYWQRPVETAAAFVAGWYHSGALGQRRDGLDHIVGRREDVYISGGENVYPAEIEAVLLTHPSVRDAAVIGVADDKWGETGLAFVCRADGASPDAGALLAHCLE